MDCAENESDVLLFITETEQCLVIYKEEMGKSKRAMACVGFIFIYCVCFVFRL